MPGLTEELLINRSIVNIFLFLHQFNNDNNNPIYKAPKALASEALAAGQSWVLSETLRKKYVLSLDLNTDVDVSESTLIIVSGRSHNVFYQVVRSLPNLQTR